MLKVNTTYNLQENVGYISYAVKLRGLAGNIYRQPLSIIYFYIQINSVKGTYARLHDNYTIRE